MPQIRPDHAQVSFHELSTDVVDMTQWMTGFVDDLSTRRLCCAEGSPKSLNAVDLRFVMPIFTQAFEAGATWLEMRRRCQHRTRNTRTEKARSHSNRQK